MSVKRRLLVSLLLAVGLTAASLLYRTGPSNLEPMPSGPGDGGRPVGVCIATRPNCFDTQILASRGWPWALVTLTPDEDQPQNYYRGIQIGALLGDLAVYFAVSSLALALVPAALKRTKAGTGQSK